MSKVEKFLVLIPIILMLIVISRVSYIATGPEIESSYSLVNLNSGKEIQGSLFLGSGYIGNRNSYYFYIKKEDGGINSIKKPHSLCTIYFDNINPRVEFKYHVRRYDSKLDALRKNAIDANIYIPKNSIKQIEGKFELE